VLLLLRRPDGRRLRHLRLDGVALPGARLLRRRDDGRQLARRSRRRGLMSAKPSPAALAAGAAVAAALLLGTCALWISVSALEQLKARSKIELAMDLQRQ